MQGPCDIRDIHWLAMRASCIYIFGGEWRITRCEGIYVHIHVHTDTHTHTHTHARTHTHTHTHTARLALKEAARSNKTAYLGTYEDVLLKRQVMLVSIP